MTNVYSWSLDADSNDTIDPPINWQEGQSPAQVNNSARAMMASVACLLRDTAGTLTAAGTSAYAVTLNSTINNLNAAFEFAFFPSAQNDGPATLSVNGLPAKPIVRRFQRQLGPGDLDPSVLYRVHFIPTIGLYMIASPDIVTAGTIRMQSGPAIYPGWLPCDGRALSRSAYAELHNQIGVVYGSGDGSTTFNIPDFRGRAPFGVDVDAGRLTSAGGLLGGLGNAGGAETVALSTAQMPSHSHTGTAQSGGGSDGGTTGPGGDHNHGGQVAAAGGHTHGLTIDEGGAHGHSGTANTAGGEARAFSFVAGSLTPGGSAQYVADINAGNVFDNKRVTSTDPGHVHSVTIPPGGNHAHTGSVAGVGDHQHGIPSSGPHVHALPAAAAHTHALAIDNTGSGAAHSNIPPGLVVQFVIKT